jgi:hypothetical protein
MNDLAHSARDVVGEIAEGFRQFAASAGNAVEETDQGPASGWLPKNSPDPASVSCRRWSSRRWHRQRQRR